MGLNLKRHAQQHKRTICGILRVQLFATPIRYHRRSAGHPDQWKTLQNFCKHKKEFRYISCCLIWLTPMQRTTAQVSPINRWWAPLLLTLRDMIGKELAKQNKHDDSSLTRNKWNWNHRWNCLNLHARSLTYSCKKIIYTSCMKLTTKENWPSTAEATASIGPNQGHKLLQTRTPLGPSKPDDRASSQSHETPSCQIFDWGRIHHMINDFKNICCKLGNGRTCWERPETSLETLPCWQSLDGHLSIQEVGLTLANLFKTESKSKTALKPSPDMYSAVGGLKYLASLGAVPSFMQRWNSVQNRTWLAKSWDTQTTFENKSTQRIKNFTTRRQTDKARGDGSRSTAVVVPLKQPRKKPRVAKLTEKIHMITNPSDARIVDHEPNLFLPENIFVFPSFLIFLVALFTLAVPIGLHRKTIRWPKKR